MSPLAKIAAVIVASFVTYNECDQPPNGYDLKSQPDMMNMIANWANSHKYPYTIIGSR